ncbi:hypothetical protein JR316_0004544 [Psilocybe cubensis]|uniref:Uncharacterized protein n=2 Tax=Psilocybe cubensis TaxID=181762 RepID=A0A8H7Y0M3_PSICU|nr:hypothetical protein JR316_0004544 [Psilocybe cubensis]KAH9482444.1 hypothetical protein JR316_0004544 [Psilocybe cubensis]
MSTFSLDYIKRYFTGRVSSGEPASALLVERLDDTRNIDETEKTLPCWPCTVPSIPSCSSSSPVVIARQSRPYSEETYLTPADESTCEQDLESIVDAGYTLDSSEVLNSVGDEEEVGIQALDIRDTNACPCANPSLLVPCSAYSSSAFCAGESSTEKIFFTGTESEIEEIEDIMDENQSADNTENTRFSSCHETYPIPYSTSKSVVVAPESDSEQSSFTISTHSVFDSSNHLHDVEDASDCGSTLDGSVGVATKAIIRDEVEVEVEASELEVNFECGLSEVMAKDSIDKNRVGGRFVHVNRIVHNKATSVSEASIYEKKSFLNRSGLFQLHDDEELVTNQWNRIPLLVAFYSGAEVYHPPTRTRSRLRSGKVWQKPLPLPCQKPDKYNYFRGGRTTSPPATFAIMQIFLGTSSEIATALKFQ